MSRMMSEPLIGEDRLRGKTALVVGASYGIGLAVAERFAAEGASVVIAGRDEARLRREALPVVERYGFETAWVAGDVSSHEGARRILESALSRFGRVDVLVNNAAAHQVVRPVEETPEEEWDAIVDTTLKGAWLMSRSVIPEMKRFGGGGSIINTSSIWGIHGAAEQSAYCSAKGGLVLLTKALALESAPYGIRVNCVAPGYTRTKHSAEFWAALSNGEEAERVFLGQIPLARAAEPDEIAGAYVYLASDDSAWVTGHTLTVDGGYTAR